MLPIRDMIRESGIPSGLEIEGEPLLFASHMTRLDVRKLFPEDWWDEIVTDHIKENFGITLDEYRRQMCTSFPSSLFEEARATSSVAHVHDRLLCAFVPVPRPDRPSRLSTQLGADEGLMPDLREGNEYLSQLASRLEDRQAMTTVLAQGMPTPDGLGISLSRQLRFDQRLTLELEALGLKGEQMAITDSKCPVMKSFGYQLEEQSVKSERANEMKWQMAEIIREQKKTFEERMNVKTAWDSALSRFLQGNRPETRPKPKRSKKKKALKQAVKQAVKQPNEGDEIPQ